MKMTDELNPTRCGCGGGALIDCYLGGLHENDLYFVYCEKCNIQTTNYLSESEAIEAWNRAMGKRGNSSRDGRKTFHVIDKTTGKEADPYDIALEEEWAKSLCYCDMEGFAILEDGTLMLTDECGKYEFPPEPDRFEVVWGDDDE